MKKFSFELEKVLEFRNFEKQQAESELAKALAVENEIQNKLNILADQIVSLKEYSKQIVNFADVMSINQNRALLDYQKEELLKELAQAKIVSDEKREVLKECMKKTTALEKMEETRFAEYKEEVKMQEKKELEELIAVKSSDKLLKEQSESDSL